jgi:hypothetical protein
MTQDPPSKAPDGLCWLKTGTPALLQLLWRRPLLLLLLLLLTKGATEGAAGMKFALARVLPRMQAPTGIITTGSQLPAWPIDICGWGGSCCW